MLSFIGRVGISEFFLLVKVANVVSWRFSFVEGERYLPIIRVMLNNIDGIYLYVVIYMKYQVFVMTE